VYVLVNLLGRVDESLLDVGGSFGGSLEEDEAVLLGELLALLGGDGPPVVEVALVADEHDRHVRVRVLPCVLQPARQVVERVPPSNIIN